MKKFLLILILFTNTSTLFSQQNNQISIIIDGFGSIECKVKVAVDSIIVAQKEPLYVLLPFRISNDIRIQDDVIYSVKVISKKYTLINILYDTKPRDLSFTVYTDNLQVHTVEGKSKIMIDFTYNDLPSSIDFLLKKNYTYYKFDIEWVPPRKLQDEEVSFFPASKVIRNKVGGFRINYKDISNKTWFVFPNFKGKKDNDLQFYLLLLIGFLTGFAQLNPILERKHKIVKYQSIISLIILVLFILLFIVLPKTTYSNIKIVAAPIVPHILYVIGGLLYLSISKKYMYKISGIVRDENDRPLMFADVELYLLESDINHSKPYKKIYELENGRFVFSFNKRKSTGFVLKISKNNRETKTINIPETRDKSYELEDVIILKKTTDNNV